MQPNRIAVAGVTVASLAAAAVTLLGAVDSTEKAIVFSVVAVVLAAVVIVYLIGWQRYEARTFVPPVVPAVPNDETEVLP